MGRRLGIEVRRHVEEVIGLVNHHRAVMVAWQRFQGPSFLAQWMNGVRHPAVPVPREIAGVTMESLLLRMGTVLKDYGSPQLRQSINLHGLELMELVEQSETIDAFISNLGKPVPA
jgi:hypothetical protein